MENWTVVTQILQEFYRSTIFKDEFVEWLSANKDILLRKEKNQMYDVYSRIKTQKDITFEEYFNNHFSQNI
jgi:3-hydroxymyristoyl/3-hydroxydecanoyl-(acyl carrier protein) dehydratase